jgi:hypothetical protein
VHPLLGLSEYLLIVDVSIGVVDLYTGGVYASEPCIEAKGVLHISCYPKLGCGDYVVWL